MLRLSSGFPAIEVRSDGNGLNPLLQHPMMTIHPVLLYAGFTGFVVPYAFAFAAMLTRRARDQLVPDHPPLDAAGLDGAGRRA